MGKALSIAELRRRKAIAGSVSGGELASQLLSFFGVATVDAWHTRYSAANVTYRHSPAFESDGFALATWLRLAEVQAANQVSVDYREPEFRAALAEVRTLTCATLSGSLAGVRVG